MDHVYYRSKFPIILLSLLVFSFQLLGQDLRFQRTNSIQVGLSGGEKSGLPLSVSYERIVLQSSKLAWSGRLGGAFYRYPWKAQKTGIAALNLIGLSSKNHWEAGVFFMTFENQKTALVNHAPVSSTRLLWYLALQGGYRRQSTDGKWLFRLGVQLPFLQKKYDEIGADKVQWKRVPLPWPTIGVGRAF